MRTTVEISDDLLVKAKRVAAERNTSLRALIEEGLRDHLDAMARRETPSRGAIRWVTVEGGLPEGLDVASRECLHRWLSENAV
jgi:hypothetical protein